MYSALVFLMSFMGNWVHIYVFLQGDIKQMEIKLKSMQGDLKKSNQVKDRLEALCRELQKQNRFIKVTIYNY